MGYFLQAFFFFKVVASPGKMIVFYSISDSVNSTEWFLKEGFLKKKTNNRLYQDQEVGLAIFLLLNVASRP